jgi:hypothetical protein
MLLTMKTNAKGYDWASWLMGIWRALVAGGAGAAGGLIGNVIVDPAHFNFTGGLRPLLTSMGISFLVVGLAHMLIFLQTHPAPDPVSVGPSNP